MKLLFVLIAILFAASSAEAQPMPECDAIFAGAGSDDVAFKPGVDVRGKPVVPADINPPMLGDEEGIVVPISVEFANQLGFVDPNVGMEGVIGFVEVMPDGRVSYNGRDLTGRVDAICAEPPASGQIPPGEIESAPSAVPSRRR